jgi:hypothetical protein
MRWVSLSAADIDDNRREPERPLLRRGHLFAPAQYAHTRAHTYVTILSTESGAQRSGTMQRGAKRSATLPVPYPATILTQRRRSLRHTTDPCFEPSRGKRKNWKKGIVM